METIKIESKTVEHLELDLKKPAFLKCRNGIVVVYKHRRHSNIHMVADLFSYNGYTVVQDRPLHTSANCEEITNALIGNVEKAGEYIPVSEELAEKIIKDFTSQAIQTLHHIQNIVKNG